MNLRIAGLLIAAMLTACTESAPPGSVPGGERQVNTYVQSDQQRPAAAGNNQGQAVIVWESYGQDGSHFGIYGQRYQQGEAVGPEFQVNTYAVGRQSMPAIAMDASGNFVVAWRSSLQDGIGGTIYGQRFSANGSRQGSEFRIGPSNSNRDSQADPSVAMNASGQFVVAWSNRELGLLDTIQGNNNNEKLFLESRVYNSNGTAQSLTPIRVTDADNGDIAPRAPRTAIDAAGNFIVVWIGGGETAAAVRARHFNGSGVATSSAYDISEARVDIGIDLPTVAMTPAGAFAIAWEGFTYGYVPVGVFLRRYSAPQSAIAPAQIVAQPSSGLAERATMTATDNGTYFLAAQSDGRVALAQISATGAVRVLGLVSSSRFPAMFPAIARSGESGLVIAWQSLGQDGGDRGIYARQATLR